MIVTINPGSSVSKVPSPGPLPMHSQLFRLKSQRPVECTAWDPVSAQDRHCIDGGFIVAVKEGKDIYRPKCVEAVISLRDDLHLIIARDYQWGEPVEKA